MEQRKIGMIVLATGIYMALGLGAANAGELPTFEFRGHKINEPATLTYPYFEIASSDCYKKGHFKHVDPSLCPVKAETEPCNKEPNGITYHCDEIPIFLGGKVGEVSVSQLRYLIYDAKIYSMRMTFGSVDATKVAAMLVGKYGTPARSISEDQQNGNGVNFTSFRNEWDFAEGTLVLREMAGRTDTGLIVFVNPNVSNAIDQQLSTAAQKVGKSAF